MGRRPSFSFPISAVFVAGLLFSALFSLRSEDRLNEAVKNYVRGNFEATFRILEEHLRTNPRDRNGIDLFVRTSVRLAENHFSKGEDEKAGFYAAQAYQYAPDDPKVKQLYSMTGKMSAEDSLKLKKREEQTSAVPAPVPGPPRTERLSKKEEVREIVKKEIVEKIKIIPKLEIREITRFRQFIPRWVYVSLLVNVVLVAVIILWRRIKVIRSRRNDALYAQYATAKLMLAQSIKEKAVYLKENLHPSKIKDILNLLQIPDDFPDIRIKWQDKGQILPDYDPLPRLISDYLEILEKFVDKPTEMIPVLKKYLEHPHNRVRATAAKAMYRFNPSLSIAAVKSMLELEDRWMRLSAVWVLDQLSQHKDAEKILLQLLEDKEREIRQKAADILKKIQEKKT
ncbi:MAG TPA: HEAT repeat domain-containing protein [bacterium]|nr:HEAT repeat domain-containing protein [bacterium]